MINDCPHCGAELATNARPHCEPPKQRCGWLTCKVCLSRINALGNHCCAFEKVRCNISERNPE